MAFRIQDVTMHLTPYNGSQPGGCSCGPASGNQPCAEASVKPPSDEKSVAQSLPVLAALRSQLRQTLPGPM